MAVPTTPLVVLSILRVARALAPAKCCAAGNVGQSVRSLAGSTDQKNTLSGGMSRTVNRASFSMVPVGPHLSASSQCGNVHSTWPVRGREQLFSAWIFALSFYCTTLCYLHLNGFDDRFSVVSRAGSRSAGPVRSVRTFSTRSTAPSEKIYVYPRRSQTAVASARSVLRHKENAPLGKDAFAAEAENSATNTGLVWLDFFLMYRA